MCLQVKNELRPSRTVHLVKASIAEYLWSPTVETCPLRCSPCTTRQASSSSLPTCIDSAGRWSAVEARPRRFQPRERRSPTSPSSPVYQRSSIIASSRFTRKFTAGCWPIRPRRRIEQTWPSTGSGDRSGGATCIRSQLIRASNDRHGVRRWFGLQPRTINLWRWSSARRLLRRPRRASRRQIRQCRLPDAGSLAMRLRRLLRTTRIAHGSTAPLRDHASVDDEGAVTAVVRTLTSRGPLSHRGSQSWWGDAPSSRQGQATSTCSTRRRRGGWCNARFPGMRDREARQPAASPSATTSRRLCEGQRLRSRHARRDRRPQSAVPAAQRRSPTSRR